MGLKMDEFGFAPITVTLTDREDGGVAVSCSDLPGLILSGPDKAGVLRAIPVAIRMLLEDAGLIDVTVHHTRSIGDLMNRALPVDVDMHVQQGVFSMQTHLFVVEARRAA